MSPAEYIHYLLTFGCSSSFADKAVDILRDWQNVNQKSVPALDVLINNAGVFDPQPRCSVQGYDSTIAVNVLAPFVLTRKLLPVLVGGYETRIITTSSISQSCQLPNLDSLFSRKSGEGGSEYDFKPLPYSAHSSYSHSKLGDLMITVQLARLLSSYELPSNVYSDMDETQRKLLNNMRSIQCLTMDPGTVNTKMLLAGWGPCGIEVTSANNTYKLATSEDYGFGRVENGSYHFGGSGSRDARDAEKLDAFFDKLSKCTGYYYKDLSDCFLLT